MIEFQWTQFGRKTKTTASMLCMQIKQANIEFRHWQILRSDFVFECSRKNVTAIRTFVLYNKLNTNIRCDLINGVAEQEMASVQWVN
jgi:hypothetical protein